MTRHVLAEAVVARGLMVFGGPYDGRLVRVTVTELGPDDRRLGLPTRLALVSIATELEEVNATGDGLEDPVVAEFRLAQEEALAFVRALASVAEVGIA